LAVTLHADLADARFGSDAHARAHALADMAGYVLHEAVQPDETLAAWIDLTFAPSWWSAEMLAGQAWYALAKDGSIAGFAAYGARDLALPWLRGYRGDPATGIFGPFGVAPEHRKTGLGEALLIAALGSLRALGYAEAAIPLGDMRGDIGTQRALHHERIRVVADDAHEIERQHARGDDVDDVLHVAAASGSE